MLLKKFSVIFLNGFNRKLLLFLIRNRLNFRPEIISYVMEYHLQKSGSEFLKLIFFVCRTLLYWDGFPHFSGQQLKNSIARQQSDIPFSRATQQESKHVNSGFSVCKRQRFFELGTRFLIVCCRLDTRTVEEAKL